MRGELLDHLVGGAGHVRPDRPIHQDLLVEWFDARLAELDAVGVMKMLPGLGKGAMTIS